MPFVRPRASFTLPAHFGLLLEPWRRGTFHLSSTCTVFFRSWARNGKIRAFARAQLRQVSLSPSLARAPYTMVRTIGSPTITSYRGSFRCLRRTFLTKSYPTMRNIKPVTLVRLAFTPSRTVPTQTIVVPLLLYLVTNALAFVSPRRRSPKPPSTSRRCVAWNGQSAPLSSGCMRSNPWSP